MRTELILGPPGTGKTTALLDIVDREVAAGVPPDQIAFLGFTRRSAEEARTRCKLPETKYFRTIHSLVFRELGLSKKEVFSDEVAQEFGEEQRLGFSKGSNFIDSMSYNTDGDAVIHIVDMAKNTKRSLKDIYKEVDPQMSFDRIERHANKLELFKERHGLYSFSDMLSEFLSFELSPELQVLIVDEAQDLTPLQWDVIRHIAEVSRPRRVYFAGDDDQTIYTWAGADVEHFNEIQFDDIRVLGKSHRVPRAVQALAEKVIAPVDRREKEWRARDAEGAVRYHPTLDSIPFDEGNWLVLSRNRCFLKSVSDALLGHGILFQWNKNWSVPQKFIRAAYYWELYVQSEEPSHLDKASRGMSPRRRRELETMSPPEVSWEMVMDRIPVQFRPVIRRCLLNDEVLTFSPRIVLSTIHAAKGGEADNVLLLTDITKKVYNSMRKGKKFEDAERRAVYVGITRTKETLHLLHLTSVYTFEELLR